MDPSALDELLVALRDIHKTRFAELAASVILLYDHVITFGQEIDYIWRKPRSVGRSLFLLNRYYALFIVIFNNYAMFGSDLSDNFCLHWFRWQGWTGLVMCMMAEVILQCRLYALYVRDKKVTTFMIAIFLASSGSSAAVMGSVLSTITATSHSIPNTPYCVAENIPSHFYAFWIPLLTFESLLCGLAVYRGFQTLIFGGIAYYSGRRLLSVLIRDSVLYFVVIFASYITIVSIWVTSSDAMLEIPIGFAVAMSCVMSNRLILNIRECQEPQYSVTPTLEAVHVTQQWWTAVEDIHRDFLTPADEWRGDQAMVGSSTVQIEMAELYDPRLPNA